MLYRDLAEPAARRRSPNGLLTRCRTENDRIIHPFALGQAADVAVPAHDCCFRSESNKTRSKIINISINTPDLSLLCCLRELESRHLSSMPRKLQERDLKKKKIQAIREGKYLNASLLRCKVSLRKSVLVYMQQ